MSEWCTTALWVSASGGDADECREPQIGYAKLIAVGIEEGVETARSLSRLKTSTSARRPMRGICSVRTRCSRGSTRCASIATATIRHRLVEALRGDFRQRTADDPHDFPIIALDDGGNQCLLAGVVVLIERADTDARDLCDPAGAGLRNPPLAFRSIIMTADFGGRADP